MKKIINIIAGLGLLSTTVSSTVACNFNIINTVQYQASEGLDSSEVSNMYFNNDNVPLVFIAFVGTDQQNKFLIVANKKDDASAEKVRKFYDINCTKQTYKQNIKIYEIKYSYTSEIFIINNQHINADIVTNIEYIK